MFNTTKIWLETLAETVHCYPDEIGNMPCDNGCPCDRCSADWVRKVYHSKVQTALLPELQKVADYMNQVDKNAENDYDIQELLAYPELHIETILRWKEDVDNEATDQERAWFDDMISILEAAAMLWK